MLPMPGLMLHALQVNLRGGRLPEPEDNGMRYLKFPIDAFKGAALVNAAGTSSGVANVATGGLLDQTETNSAAMPRCAGMDLPIAGVRRESRPPTRITRESATRVMAGRLATRP